LTELLFGKKPRHGVCKSDALQQSQVALTVELPAARR
jgi:hypothetical protein